MADSITLKSSAYDGRYLQAECTQISKDNAKNTSTVKWKLSSIGGAVNNGYPVYYSTGPTALVIGGNTVYSQGRVGWETGKFPANLGSVEGTVTIQHNNDGTKEITVSLSTAIYTSAVSTHSDKWTLDPIPRYATAEHSLSSNTETTATINWASDKTIDQLWYSINNGSSWVNVGEVNAKSGTYTINGLTANTAYKIKTRVRSKESQLTTDSTALSVTTYDYPHCIESPNFIIGNEVELKFYNPLRHTIGFNIIANGVKLTYDWTAEGTTYKGLYAEGVQTQLYNSIPNDPSGKYQVVVTYGSVVRTWDNGNTYSIDTTKCLPVFKNFIYSDTSYVANITGNNQVLVKNLSTLSVGILNTQKMITKNGATPDKYVISIDTKSEPLGYADADISKDMGSISNKGALRLTVRAFDSRGLYAEAYKDIKVYDYEKPVINVDAKRLNNFETQTTLKVNGTFSLVTLDNGVNANTVLKVFYRYREVGGAWGNLEEFAKFTISDNKYTCSDVVLLLDNSKAFEFEILTYDAMSYNTVTATVSVGQAVFFVSSNQKACYINGQKILMYDVVETWGGW